MDNTSRTTNNATEIDAVLAAVSQVYNGGFGQFFFNRPASYQSALTGFRLIGLPVLANLLIEAYAQIMPFDEYLDTTDMSRLQLRRIRRLEADWSKHCGDDGDIVDAYIEQYLSRNVV